jgi:sulfide dehydrogenase cytochrome subunit
MADSATAAKGAKLHDRYCEKCHAEGGTSAEDDSGILAGQWIPYLQHAMDDFTNERRDMPKKMGKQLSKMMDAHGDAGMKELLEFYASRK